MDGFQRPSKPRKRCLAVDIDAGSVSAEEAARNAQLAQPRRGPRKPPAPRQRVPDPSVPDDEDGFVEDLEDEGSTGDALAALAQRGGGARDGGSDWQHRQQQQYDGFKQRRPQAIEHSRAYAVQQQAVDAACMQMALRDALHARIERTAGRHACVVCGLELQDDQQAAAAAAAADADMAAAAAARDAAKCAPPAQRQLLHLGSLMHADWDAAGCRYVMQPGASAARPASVLAALDGGGTQGSDWVEDDGGSSGGSTVPAMLAVTGYRQVTYVLWHMECVIHVPTYRCSCCGEQWEVQAEDVGCAPSSPVMPAVWYDAAYAEGASHLMHSAGLSATAMADAMEDVSQRYWLDGSKCTVADDDRLRTAAYEHRRVVRAALEDLGQLGASHVLEALGPAAHCPACASVPIPTDVRQEGWDPQLIRVLEESRTPASPPLLLAAMIDASQKLNRINACGAGQQGMEPVFSAFFGAANSAMRSAASAGTQGSTGGASGDSDDNEQTCHPNLSCAREYAAPGGILDNHGVVGAVCSHGSPLLGSFLIMLAAENFTMYDGMLQHLTANTHIQDLYFDLGCKYAPHLRKLASGDPDSPVAQLLARIQRVLVPWFHAQSHGPDCYLINSGLYNEGAGRRVGEQTEQFWALAKPMARLARFMGPFNHHDFVDDGFWRIACKKVLAFPSLMTSMHAAVEKKHAECETAVQEMEAAASRNGQLLELRAAAEAARAPMAAENNRQHTHEVQYARLTLRVEALASMRSNSSLVVSLPGADAQLRAKVHDARYLERLSREQAKMARKAGFLDVDPSAVLDTPRFKLAHARLRLDEVKKLQACVERMVGELQDLQGQRKGAGSSSKTTRSLRNRTESRRKRIRSLLADLHAWAQVQGLPALEGDGIISAMPDAWDSDSMANLLRGAFPWRGGGVATPQQLALMVQAEKYRDATAELLRTKEERVVLSWERAESVRYFQHMQDRLRECAVARAAAGSMDSNTTFACVLRQRVDAALLMCAVAKFVEQQAECEKRFANMRTYHKV